MATQNGKKLQLFIFEEQQILRDAYVAALESHDRIRVVGSSGDTGHEAIAAALKLHNPAVILLGVKILQGAVVQTIKTLWENSPETPVLLLAAAYDMRGIKALRDVARTAAAGYALLLKQGVDTMDEVVQVLYSVVEGRIVLDPKIMEGLMASSDPSANFIKELSPREMEVLSWMAKGLRNEAIAEVLSIDGKTIERHINNLYSKVGSSQNGSRHQRVNAIMLYLRATGQLPPDQYSSD